MSQEAFERAVMAAYEETYGRLRQQMEAHGERALAKAGVDPLESVLILQEWLAETPASKLVHLEPTKWYPLRWDRNRGFYRATLGGTK